MWIFLNDRIVDERDAVVSVFDRGFMYGDGVFETLRLYAGRPFQMDRHLDRLESSACMLRIPLPRTRDQIAGDVGRVAVRNGLEDGIARIAVSRGVGRRGPSMEGASAPTYVVSVGPLPDDLAERHARGIALAVVGTIKPSTRALPAGAKHANYLNSVLAFAEAADAGADDALLLAGSGEVAECSGANVFLVRESRVLTPHLGAGILPGLARAHVLALCRRSEIPAAETRLELSDLAGATEVFVTNRVVEVLPVRSVDDRRYPAPGPVTARLRDLYGRSVVTERAHS